MAVTRLATESRWAVSEAIWSEWKGDVGGEWAKKGGGQGGGGA